MILAAGRGERMRPLTDSCPKPLLTINGKPIIVYHLEALKKAGITSVVINVSWMADKIIQYLGDGSAYGVSITYSDEPEALETAGGIINALDKLDDEFIVVNGDVFTDYDFSRLTALTRQAHLVLVDNPTHNQHGDFSIHQGVLSNNESCRFTFSGIACYQKSFFSDVIEGKQALAPLLRKKANKQLVTAEIYQGVWSDVGTPQRLNELQSQHS